MPGQAFQTPVEINVFTHILGLVVTTQFLEDAPSTELASSLRHAADKPKNAPDSQVDPQQDSPGLVHGIDSSAGTNWIRHRSGNPEQQSRRNHGVRVQEDQDVVQGSPGPGIPCPGDAVLCLADDRGTSALRKLGCAVGARVIDDNDLNGRVGGCLEVPLRGAEPVESFENVSGFVKGRDDYRQRRHYHAAGVQPAFACRPIHFTAGCRGMAHKCQNGNCRIDPAAALHLGTVDEPFVH